MARSSNTTVEIIRRRGPGTVVPNKYVWPVNIMNFWTFIMTVTAGVLIGVFAAFVNVQNRFRVGIPWIFPFGITVGALLAVFIILIMALNLQGVFVPGYAIVISFALFVLFLTGTIETGIQLFGPNGNVNHNCQTYVLHSPVSGGSVNTLAYLEQSSICQAWYAAFAFWIIGDVFLLWLIVIAITATSTTRAPDIERHTTDPPNNPVAETTGPRRRRRRRGHRQQEDHSISSTGATSGETRAGPRTSQQIRPHSARLGGGSAGTTSSGAIISDVTTIQLSSRSSGNPLHVSTLDDGRYIMSGARNGRGAPTRPVSERTNLRGGN